MVLAAGELNSPDSRAALESLCRSYWPPLYAFLRRSGQPPEVAQDQVQGYLARLLERGDLARVAPERGRFRSYLLAGLRNFLVSEARRESAEKRGGTSPLVSIDADEVEQDYLSELGTDGSPEGVFDRQWANTVLERALERLREEHSARGKSHVYEMLKPTLTGDADDDHASLGSRLGMSPGAVGVAVHRLRQRMRELVRSEVEQTVGSQADLDDEMRYLLVLWAS
jgi:RNA polymerase sigma factor (sigma-70 family)